MYKSFRRCFKIEYAFVSNKSQRPKRLGCCSSVAHLESRISRFRTRSHMRFCAFGEIATIRFIFHVASVFGFCFRFCLRTRTFLHELLLASADPPKSQRNWNCLQLICILNAIENAALFMAHFWAERN